VSGAPIDVQRRPAAIHDRPLQGVHGDLVRRLLAIHVVRAHGEAAAAGALEDSLAGELCADRRLAVYGSLAPGEENHGELAPLAGRWLPGTVRGRLLDRGWGARLGFPALRWDPEEPEVAVQLFESDDLPRRWVSLDAFEGPDYERRLVPVCSAEGVLAAWLYVLAEGRER
jgi:gamma-glutamylcyclotransferase (GGCT)/AIG2-like uncharacterized protein YtfP